MAKSMTIVGVLLVSTLALAGPPEAGAEERLVPSETPVGYSHADQGLDSALKFVAEAVTEDSHRIAKPTYRVNVTEFCTLRFDRLDAGGGRVPVRVVSLGQLDPRESSQFERMTCFETTSLQNQIAYYELAANLDSTYSYDGSPLPDSRRSTDRFCFYVSRAHSHRVSRALTFALDVCGATSIW